MTRNASFTAIWRVVSAIPAGCVATYGQVARLAGLPRRARLVGQVLGEAGTELPWHRVINAQGRSSLPANSRGQREQKRRLREEGVVFSGGRVDLARYGWHVGDDSPLLD
jgi:methylated-DNA-protein-cysteine methyltransferase-like protein